MKSQKQTSFCNKKQAKEERTKQEVSQKARPVAATIAAVSLTHGLNGSAVTARSHHRRQRCAAAITCLPQISRTQNSFAIVAIHRYAANVNMTNSVITSTIKRQQRASSPHLRPPELSMHSPCSTQSIAVAKNSRSSSVARPSIVWTVRHCDGWLIVGQSSVVLIALWPFIYMYVASKVLLYTFIHLLS